MADIFDEVGEDLRRERMKKLWQGYGAYLIAAAVLVVLATAGWRAWESWQQSRAETAAVAYRAALAPAADGDHLAAADALVAFSSDAPGDYPLIARMRAATERAAAGETDTALATFEAIAGNADASAALRGLASIRAAMIALDRDNLDQVRARLAPLDTPDGVYRHAARELLAVAALRAEDYAAARQAIEALMADPEVPAGFRQRATLLQEIIDSAVAAPVGEAEGGS